MSITGSLSNALSGLTAASRAAEVVSANVANALTDGYGRREISLGSQSIAGNGAGVRVNGVYRTVDERIVTERRLADASLGYTSASNDFFAELEQVLGLPDDPASITGLMAQFESALIEAASRPDSEPRLNAVLSAAQGISEKFNAASDKIQQMRMQADQDIGREVDLLNRSLARITEINNDIRSQLSAGYDANALMDQRQQMIDSISAIVPLQQVPRDGGQVALFTTGGAILLDGRPAIVGFTPVGVIVPQMTLGSSTLSGLTLNGQPVVTTSVGPLSGGSLAGLFLTRDDLAVAGQQRLDAVARDVVERFADPAVDPTLAATDPGIFTDSGAAFATTNEVGLSSRLSINALIDPASGGAVWRIRDGLGAAAQGDVGNANQILALVDALNAPKIPATGGFIGAARSAIGLAGDMVSLLNVDLGEADALTSYARAQVDTFKAIELQGGVDTDYELQQLLLIEQAYTANARVLTTIDEMISTLLRI